MTVILLEALAALVLLLVLVWWTMFSGRKKGELPGQHEPDDNATLGKTPAAAARSSPDDDA